MKRFALLAGTLLHTVLLGIAHAQQPLLRTTFSPEGGVLTGQRATLVVELLAPGFFAGTSSFDLPDTSGLLLVPPEGSPIVSSETINKISYTVQRHELPVFTHRPGVQVIPSIPVRFQYKAAPLDKDAVAVSLKTDPVSFQVKSPPGAEQLGSIITARGLTAVESWNPEPGPCKAGDAFTRIIRYAAPEVPGMAFPPFPTGNIDGLSLYPKPPVVHDESNRGSLTGHRSDTVVYVCEHPGTFVIPGIRLTWYDLDAQALQTIDFPARTLTVAPNPALATAKTTTERPAAPTAPDPTAWIGWLVGLTVALLLWYKVSPERWRRISDPLLPTHLASLNPGDP